MNAESKNNDSMPVLGSDKNKKPQVPVTDWTNPKVEVVGPKPPNDAKNK